MSVRDNLLALMRQVKTKGEIKMKKLYEVERDTTKKFSEQRKELKEQYINFKYWMIDRGYILFYADGRKEQ